MYTKPLGMVWHVFVFLKSEDVQKQVKKKIPHTEANLKRGSPCKEIKSNTFNHPNK